MNPENNNVENSMGVQPGIDQLNEAPVTPEANQNTFEPMQNMDMPSSDEAFSPFENLNSEALNVPTEAPTEQFNPTPVDPSTFNADATFESEPVSAPAVEEVPQVENTFNTEVQPESQDFAFQQPAPVEAAPVESSIPVADTPVMDNGMNFDTPSAEPVNTLDNQTNFSQPMTFDQAAPVVEELTPAADTVAPEVAPVESFDQNVAPVEGLEQTSTADVPAATPVEEPQGPTIPIPDSMPTTDYQATVSTPVDYATPMSDFDQIGSTPEIDPKAKTKKGNSKKTIMFLFILVVIAGLGCGAYYLINIKQIFKTSSVETKNITIDSGDTLSTNIDDYGVFKNTQSSNCVLDTNKVDTSKAGKYTYVISCGEDKYEGTITVIDKSAPEVELNFKYTVAPQPIYKEDIVRSVSEENAEYNFTSEEEANQAFSTPGFNVISMTVKDASGNSKEVLAPVAVLSSDMQFILVGQKATDKTNVIEKLVTFIRSDITVEIATKMYVITFDTDEEYNKAVESYNGGKEFTYDSYTGIPVFYKSEKKLVIITDTTLPYVGQQANPVYGALVGEGYSVTSLKQQDNDKSIVNFDTTK